MGVIRWVEMSSDRHCGDGVMVLGYLGDERICYVADYGPDPNADGIFHLFTHSEFPGCRFSERWTPCDDLEHGKHLAEMLILDWMTDVGLVSKAEFDEARRSAEHFIRELRASLETSKRRFNEIKALREELADIKSTAEFSRSCYSNLHQKHVELGNDYLELLRAVGKIKKIAGEAA